MSHYFVIECIDTELQVLCMNFYEIKSLISRSIKLEEGQSDFLSHYLLMFKIS